MLNSDQEVIELSQFVLLVLEQIERLTDEMDLTGIHKDGLPNSIHKFNDALAIFKETDPEQVVWRLITPLDPANTTASDLALACRALIEIVREQMKRAQMPSTWRVTEETTLDGVYEGNIVITQGCTFHLNGTVTGHVTIEKDAVLNCNGYLKGDVDKDASASLIINGKIAGDISTTSHNVDEHRVTHE
jgi:hypothetical protein